MEGYTSIQVFEGKNTQLFLEQCETFFLLNQVKNDAQKIGTLLSKVDPLVRELVVTKMGGAPRRSKL
jgi:hypothetical protein